MSNDFSSGWNGLGFRITAPPELMFIASPTESPHFVRRTTDLSTGTRGNEVSLSLTAWEDLFAETNRAKYFHERTPP